MFNPFPIHVLDSFKLKEFADKNVEFVENGRKFSKRVGNIVGKGEIARYEQFSLPSVFKTLALQTRKNQEACLGKGCTKHDSEGKPRIRIYTVR